MKKKLSILLLLGFLTIGCEQNRKTPNYPPTEDNSDDQQLALEDVEVFYESAAGVESESSLSIMTNDFDFIGFYNYYPKNNDIYKSTFEYSRVISSFDDVIDLLDYGAFYGKDEIVVENISSSYLGSVNINETLNEAWWSSSICVGNIGFTSFRNKSDNTLRIKFLKNDFANCFKAKKETYRCYPITIPYSYYGDGKNLKPRNSNNTIFPYQKKSVFKTIDVYNSDQIIYALEKGYGINIISNSPAEIIYKKATSILNEIIDDSMEIEDKIIAIQAWIESHNIYDWGGCADAGYVRKDGDYINFPDYMASMMSCFYAEGALLYGACTCQAMSKGFALLGLIEGLDLIKVNNVCTSINKSETISSIDLNSGYFSHGYCYVKIDGSYYICDSDYSYVGTMGTSVQNESGNNCTYAFNRNMGMLLSYDNWKTIYNMMQKDYFISNHEDEMTNQTKCASEFIKINAGDDIISCCFKNENETSLFLNNIKEYLKNYNRNIYNKTDAPLPVYLMPIYFEYAKFDEDNNDSALIDQFINDVIDTLNDEFFINYTFVSNDENGNIDSQTLSYYRDVHYDFLDVNLYFAFVG